MFWAAEYKAAKHSAIFFSTYKGYFAFKNLVCNLFHIVLDIYHARFTMCLTCPEWKLLVLLGSRGASRSCLTSSKLLENWGKKVQPSHMGVK